MKKILVLITAVAGILVGCSSGTDDMSSPPATTTSTNAASTNQ